MTNVSGKCTNCGAIMEIDKEKDAYICKYCGNAVITAKAIQAYTNHITNNINIQSSGNTINIINNSTDKKNRFDTNYKIKITRPNKFMGGAAQWIFDIDEILYTLSNGQTIEIETDLKKVNTTIIMKFADGEQKRFRLTIAPNGKDVEMLLAPTFLQSIKIISCNCNATIIRI